jgi:hypothetical protein
MSVQIDAVGHRTAMPVVAGIFDIVIGGLCVLGAIVVALIALLSVTAVGSIVGIVPFFVGFGILVIAIPIIILGALSIAGGVFSLQRKMWGWALHDFRSSFNYIDRRFQE